MTGLPESGKRRREFSLGHCLAGESHLQIGVDRRGAGAQVLAEDCVLQVGAQQR